MRKNKVISKQLPVIIERLGVRRMRLVRHRGRLWMINEIGEAMALDKAAEVRLERALKRFFAKEF